VATFRVEYLIIIESKDSFCSSVASFNHLLKSNDDIDIKANRLIYKDLACDYEVQTGSTNNDAERFFHIWITCQDVAKLDVFEEMLRAIRVLLSKAGNKQPQVLWDDISLHYANKSYPVIHDIENLMRKLITKFMLTNIGLGWTKEAIPQEVIDSIRVKDKNTIQNYLYEVDFIQLSNFLFKEYSTANTKRLLDKICQAKLITEIDIDELKSLVPSSNWERYFSPIVKCDSDFLKVRWEKLYELRCKVAHNKLVTKSDHEEIKSLVDETKPKLQSAIESLEQLQISQEDREQVADNVASSISDLYAEFINYWQHSHTLLYELALLTASEEEKPRLIPARNNIRSLLNILAKKKQVISRGLRSRMLELFKFKNVIVHNSDVVFPEENIKQRIVELAMCYSEIIEKHRSREQGKDITEANLACEDDDIEF